MFHITEEDVLAYVAGAVTDPELRAAIEEARDTDHEVQYWFDLLDPDADEDAEEIVVVLGRDDETLVSEHYLDWSLAAKGDEPPVLDHSTDLPFRHIDTETETVILKYPAESIPLGVARIVVKAKDSEDRELGSTLVVFRTFRRGKDQFVRIAETPFDALGLFRDDPSWVRLYVTPARTTNLDKFPREQVCALRDACNGDSELRTTVEALIRLLPTDGK